MNASKPRAVGYVRVSTVRQTEGESLADQRAKVTKRIEAEGWELISVYEEAGRSGRKVERPQLQALLGSLEGIDRLVIPRLDRLGRNAAHLYEVYKQLDDAGVGLVSVREGLDTSTAIGKLMRGVLSSIAELESDQIAERLEDFNARKIEDGLYNGGPRPLGYRFTGGALEIVPEEAEIVRRIFAEYIRGDSMRSIANRLQDERVPTPRMKGTWDSTKGSWTSARVRERVESVIYRGDLGSRVHGRTRPGAHEAIVSREVWEKAAARRDGQRNQSGAGRGRPTNALLPGGFVRCLVCGESMRPRSAGSYRCAGRDEKRNGCPMPSVPRRAVDDALREYFLHYVFDPDASRVEYEAEREREASAAREASTAARRAEQSAASRRATIKRLMQEETMPYTEWAKQDAELVTEEAEARSRADIEQRRLDALLAPDDARFEDWQALREHALGDLSKDTDRARLRSVLQRIFQYVGIGIVRNDDPELVDPDTLSFEHRGQTFLIWVEIKPEAMVPLEGFPDAPASWTGDRDQHGDPLLPEPSPWPKPQGIPSTPELNERKGLPCR